MSIETKAKALVALHKKELKICKQLEAVRKSIRDDKEALNKNFKQIGLVSSFSS